jgi:N-acetylmuramoyl-L-alanine amidase
MAFQLKPFACTVVSSFMLIVLLCLLPSPAFADIFDHPKQPSYHNTASSFTVPAPLFENYSLAATASTTTSLWALTPEGLTFQPSQFLKIESSTKNRFYARPIAKTNQLLIEFPNAQLKPTLASKVLVGTVNQNGIKTITLSEHKGSLLNSVRIVVSYAPTVSVEKLQPAQMDNQLLLVPFPIVASNNTSHQTTGTIEGTTVVPYRFRNTPTVVVPPSSAVETISPPEAVVVASAPANEAKVAIKGLEVESEFLLLKPAEGAGLLKVKNQFYLEKPHRFVVDLEPASLSADLFTGTEPSPAAPIPTSGVTQWNGWTVRLSQNTPSIVRLVIETDGNKNFKLLEGSLQAPLAFRNALVVQPAASNKNPYQVLTSNQGGKRQGNLTQVYFSPPTSKGAVKMRVEASLPIDYKLTNEVGNRLVLSLPNIAPPENGGVQSFDVKSFPYLKAFSHVAAAKGSALLIDFTMPVKELRSLPFTAQRALELSFLVPTNPTAITSAIRNPKGRIVVDAGHGGKDQGASRAGVLEKDLNLACATYLVDALKRRGLEVYTTRSTDKFLELKEISAIANQYAPDLFISVHHNSSVDASIAGLETYYYHYPSMALAKAVHASLVNALPVKDRGVRKAQFYVINHTTAPAILIEMGYLSNGTERGEVNTTARQKKSAEAVADGVLDYLRQLKR